MKFWAIGDSFVDPYEGAIRTKKWASIMKRNLKSDKYFLFGNGGFDAETILDNLLLNLHLIEDDDLVVIFLPTLWRHRLTLNEKMINNYEEFIDSPITNIDDVELLKGFVVGNNVNDVHKLLSPPLNQMNTEDLVDEEMKETTFEKNLNFHKFITSEKASILRIESILKSVKKLKPKVNFELFTWCEDEYSDFIKNMQTVEKEMGFYETHHMAWKKGKIGVKGDHHFSNDMNERFAIYLMSKYPNHFHKKEYKYNLI